MYEGHRIILPGIRDRAYTTCETCRYFVQVIGREETKPVCLAEFNIYLTGEKRVPKEMNAVDFIMMAGREKLKEAIKTVGKGCDKYCDR
ncbi:hypothetical protein MTBGP_11980 [Moorella thermoacetica]